MTDKQTITDPIAHAARLLREAAEELRQAHAYNRSEGWENETDAKAACDEHMAAAQALEAWEAAVGAGGVQALSAGPAGWKLVPVEPTNDMQRAADEWAAKGFDWPKAVYRAMLTASPKPPAEQQAAPKAAPGEHSDPVEAEYRKQLAQRGKVTTREWFYAGALWAQAAPQQEAQEPCGWAVYDSLGFYELHDTEAEAKSFCDHYNKRLIDLKKPYTYRAHFTAPQPAPAPLSEREEIAMIDAAMVEMANIVPPLKRSECARLIRAAMAAQGGQ